MPIYEFQCDRCEKIIERWQSHRDPFPENCDSCGGNLSKIMSRTTFQLKGSGWYVTDYCKKSDKSSSVDNSKCESKNDSSSKDTKEAEKKSQTHPSSNEVAKKTTSQDSTSI